MDVPMLPDPLDLVAVFAALPGATVLFAADPPRFTVLAANDAFLTVSRRSRDAVVGRPLAEAFCDANAPDHHRVAVADLGASLTAAMRTGAQQRMDRRRYDLQCSDGTLEVRYWDVVNIPVPGPDGAARYLLHQTADVTAQVRGEGVAERAERRAEGILEQMGDAHCVLDRAFRIVSVNAAAERVLGVSRASLLGRSHWDAFPSTAHTPVGHAFRRVVAEGVEQHLTHHYTGEGYDLHLEVDAYPTDEGGLAVFWRDVTERMRAGAGLRASEARFHAVADLVPELLWESDADGSRLWYNARWLEYTGQTPDQARGWGWMESVHPEDRAGWAPAFARAVERGETYAYEKRLRRHDGVYRWFLVRAEPFRGADGRVVRWFGAATDVHTQRTALEEVESLVAERTAERDTLRRQLAAAEEAERRRLARELHDQLGQHLTAFALGLDEVRRLLAVGESADVRLARLEELSRMMTRDARYIALELRPPELDDVGLHSALRTYVDQWSGRYGVPVEVTVTGAEVERPIPDEVSTTLYRIVQEALTNVAKHARATQVSVMLDMLAREARLIVEDDGQGFDVEAAGTRVRREPRFGLAGMRERAALVGGTLEVESDPGGRGTTLYVRVPLCVS